jgi:uncharacterized protein YbaR (Trm112 family)
MKKRLLELLGCPECGAGSFAMTSFAAEEGEIVDGLLRCKACSRRYPIIGGVPRLLPDALMSAVERYHANFFGRYGLESGKQEASDEVARTLHFYSYARAKLFTPELDPALLAYWQKSLNIRIPGAPSLQGRLGLDAGCGEGRYTYCLAESGAEVIGMDLSEAVNLAYLRNRSQPRAHIVQGSIYQPPFRRGALDFVLSTGVLHHLPDPQAGFEALVPLLRPGGTIHLWLYGLRQMSPVYRLSHLTLLRRLGSRLSPRTSYLVSVPLALVLHLMIFRPVRILAGTGLGRRRVDPQLRELASLSLQMHVAEVQDRIGVPVTHYLTGDELRAWYDRAGLQEVTVEATHGGRGWSARGRLVSEKGDR